MKQEIPGKFFFYAFGINVSIVVWLGLETIAFDLIKTGNAFYACCGFIACLALIAVFVSALKWLWVNMQKVILNQTNQNQTN